MATVEQVTSVKDLHESNDRTMAGWDQTVGEYNISDPDPYELSAAKVVLAAPVSISTTGTAVDITVDDASSDCAAAVTTWGGSTITTGIVYSIEAGTTSATINQDGLVEASGEDGGNGTVITTATSGELSVSESIVITNQASE